MVPDDEKGKSQSVGPAFGSVDLNKSDGSLTRSGPSGKTFADVLEGILTIPTKLLSFIAILTTLAGLVFVVIFLLQRLIGVTPSEITISPTGSTQVMFAAAAGKNKEYLIMVHPQGWQNTRIPVRPGDRLTFAADGSVNIDLNTIVENVIKRHKYEAAVAAEHGVTEESRKEVPEQYFTEKMKQSLKPASPWVGPDGYKDVAATAWAGRIKNRVMPDEPGGALIGAVSQPGGATPREDEVFMIGKEGRHVSVKDGDLWFNVNDVRNFEDPNNANLFYLDNIGFFWVKVTIESK
jgi:hypothetical protein